MKEQIADYVWLDKTQRSWHIYSGNPFVLGKYIIPLKELSKEEVITMAKRENEKERKRFTKLFPDTKWEVFKDNKDKSK